MLAYIIDTYKPDQCVDAKEQTNSKSNIIRLLSFNLHRKKSCNAAILLMI